MFKHLLMPTDGSDASARALAKGAELDALIRQKLGGLGYEF